jgi:hexosaminidase
VAAPRHRVVPAPVTLEPTAGSGYELTAQTAIHAPPRATAEAEYLAGLLRAGTGLPLPVTAGASGSTGIRLVLTGGGADSGPDGERYQLAVDGAGVTIEALCPAGLFHGVQTLRQLLPAAVESRTPQPGPWPVPAVRVSDAPRFRYRGAMLDVARHFFCVDAVKGYLDRLALYKLNHLHLHLTDDQGWRLAIETWPELARHGGATEVGGGPGGYYTRTDYEEIVAYAAARHITIVPEIDLPGHTNAALSAYPELNRDGVAPDLYTGTTVGFSSLCAEKEITYRFVADVLGELAALTPGPYLHIGGDEAFATTPDEYATFMTRVQPVVAALGKTVLGWQEISAVDGERPRVLQYWRPDGDPGSAREHPDTAGPRLAAAVGRGDLVLLSPANRTYLDMKYDGDTLLGLNWAGTVEVRDAYDWDPGSYLDGVPESAVLGVEAPLWSETVATPDEVDYLAFPRLPAVAEAGWSPAAARDWEGFRVRLAAHAPRWKAAGITYHPSAQVPWDTAPDPGSIMNFGS